MKKIKLLSLLLALNSFSAFAGYECVLKLAHSDDFHKTIAEKTVSIGKGMIRAGSQGTLYVESSKKKRKTTLDINAVLSGWEGEEDATFVVIRWISKKRSVSYETASDKITLKGDDSQRLWFEDYKLDIDCKVIQE